jgi:hypothetical protein
MTVDGGWLEGEGEREGDLEGEGEVEVVTPASASRRIEHRGELS